MGHPVIEAGMMGGKLDLLAQVGKVKLKKRKKRLKTFTDLIGEIKNSNTDRITAIHGVWQPPIVNFLRFVVLGEAAPAPVATKRGRVDKPDTKLEAARAVKVAERISELHYDLREFAAEAWPNLFSPLDQ